MATYIVLIRYTQKGIENIKQGPQRVDAVRQLLQSAGAEMRAFYLTFGRYDAVSIIEAPDDETAARLLLTIGMQGNVKTETLKAFPEDEYRRIIAALP
jgi:uncharacterized protein with GYD domain